MKMNDKPVSRVDTTHKTKLIYWASLAPIYGTLQSRGNTVQHILEGEIYVTTTIRTSGELVEVIRLAYDDANHLTSTPVLQHLLCLHDNTQA